MQTAIPTVVMRGGTSKGLYFLKDDLPADEAARDRLLLAAMGSPDVRQIDGMGGAHPLTSKVAVVSRSKNRDADVDYLFLQVLVEKALVSDGQNCGNILAGVGPFAIEKGLVRADPSETTLRIRMLNSGGIAVTKVITPGGQVSYEGAARIDGVPGTAAPVMIDFADVAGSNCGALLPTGKAVDRIDGISVTCVDNGMPVVVMRASDFGRTGHESPGELEQDEALKSRVESIRIQAGPMMNLGDVTGKTVPKMSLIAPPRHGGVVATRTFIPHRVHQSIGVLGAASVAAVCCITGSIAEGVTEIGPGGEMDIEHPTGRFTVDIGISEQEGRHVITRSALLRTARKLMDGTVYVPQGAAVC
ncbi:MAG: 4-oxalomesaconate tautomerase [Gammaproteobacteria bacterium]|nr:4-oxalomesaconate tautomerase [Gammaproteobacteria bacterium]MYD02197.1 4-oxalomesaconate tautomerase [Gammaproteobacteria bacterium]MYI24338.1 4-oxalomesaconate tautomerase [Gammaproteobacteria bacterium]